MMNGNRLYVKISFGNGTTNFLKLSYAVRSALIFRESFPYMKCIVSTAIPLN